jgi:hypothetical protein
MNDADGLDNHLPKGSELVALVLFMGAAQVL